MKFNISDSAKMKNLGSSIGSQLRSGDFVVLAGELGAGKTTFTQGLAEGLNVGGSITSPTFVISRIHKPIAQGPKLIHVDAYRLTNADQLVDLELDEPNSVVVIEWGSEFIKNLTDTWLEINIERGSEIDPIDPAAGNRVVTVTAYGDRWRELDLAGWQ